MKLRNLLETSNNSFRIIVSDFDSPYSDKVEAIFRKFNLDSSYVESPNGFVYSGELAQNKFSRFKDEIKKLKSVILEEI